MRHGLTIYYTRTCRIARKILVNLGSPFLSEVIAESVWRAMGWVCDQRPHAIINALKHVFKWRSTKWWQTTETIEMTKIHTITRGGNTSADITADVSGTRCYGVGWQRMDQ